MRKRKWPHKTGSEFDPWKQNGVCCSCNLPSRYLKVFHGIKHNDYESITTTKRHSYSVRFFRPLCSQTRRIRKNEKKWSTRIEESYAQETTLIGYLHQLLCILNEWATMSLPGNCRTIQEGYTELVWGVGYSAYCNDNRGRRSWKTTV